MSNSNDKKFSPRFAKTPDELVFYSDTDQSDYPIYLTPSFEVKIKKRPEDVERYATFHLKTVEVKSFYDGKDYLYRGLPPLLGGRSGNKVKDLNDYVRAYPQLPLQTIFNVVADLKCTVYVREMQLNYEVYKGDYEEPVAEAPATVLAVILEPPYADKFESQRFAITYSTLKRLLSKLPPDVATTVQRIAYVDKKVGSRSGAWPFIKIKFCLPSPELSNAFNEVKKWLEGAEEAQVQVSEAEAEGVQVPVQVQVPEIKPKELEVELETPAVPTAVQPQPQVPVAVPPKPSLVKVYLLSMRLPSKYLVQEIEIDKNVETRKWEGKRAEIASRLETIRRTCYTKAEHVFAHVEEYGTWIAVTDEAVEEAKKISEYIKSELSKLQIDQVKKVDLNAYSVKAIPVYLEPEDAKEILNAAIAHLSADVDELESKIAEAEKEQKKEALKRLESNLKYKQELLNAFKRFLQTLT
jgi:hypothetical protein